MISLWSPVVRDILDVIHNLIGITLRMDLFTPISSPNEWNSVNIFLNEQHNTLK